MSDVTRRLLRDDRLAEHAAKLRDMANQVREEWIFYALEPVELEEIAAVLDEVRKSPLLGELK